MVKFPEAAKRLFGRTFVCKKCKTKIKAPPQKVIDRKVKCRRCGYKILRPIKKGTK
ncbi:MAG: 50S ribosomal protein L40e [Nanoarchaeota archaeon]|nr:50S ribosomal protein L40e [Nanoarchaeota archaeon]MBU0962743.1 50S ribosomal protein L40e [Nanoarchaeota archaeon]